MGIFRKSTNITPLPDISEKTGNENIFIERPRICCIDIGNEIISALKQNGANIYEGTLGAKIKIPNSRHHDNHVLLLKYDFPPNLHEYDIFIIDLNRFSTIDYKSEDHTRKMHSGKSSLSLLSSHPETLFDPRPLSSLILGNQLRQISNRKYLVLAFSSEAYEIEYDSVLISENGYERQGTESHNIYSFWDNIPTSDSKYGEELFIGQMREDMYSLLDKFKSGIFYNQTFYHPITWTNSGSELNSRYFPLYTNLNGDIVSFMESRELETLILLPQIEDKKNFILEFIYKVAPSIIPELFPYSTTFGWKDQPEYWLPKHADLIQENKIIQTEFEKQLKENQHKIENNFKKYSFLHNILTETGEELVTALIKYFKWLEFENIENVDEANSNLGILEEDIQINLPNGILIIECKGIGGTSTDSDCNQISKIKHRRCKERNKFDVFALYIVNHQRYLPPLKRQNPPFSQHQIQDAKNDERGLVSTWQLYNLYFEIENGIISKEEARNAILEYGLIEFRPKNLIFIQEPIEIFNDGLVCIVNIDGIDLSVNDELYIERNGKFKKVKLEDIQDNGKSIKQISKGEYGLRLSSKITKKSILWKKAVPNIP